MIAPDPRRVPVGAAIGQGLFAIMEIVFHLGAHRTGSTTFQSYMHDNIRVLEDGGIAYWGPKTTRKGLFRGLIPTDPANEGRTATQERAEARVARHLEEAAKSGTAAILVSEENMIGSVRGCVRAGALYPDVGARLACYARAFDGDVTRIALAIRSQDRFWASALAFAAGRGHPVPYGSSGCAEWAGALVFRGRRKRTRPGRSPGAGLGRRGRGPEVAEVGDEVPLSYEVCHECKREDREE